MELALNIQRGSSLRWGRQKRVSVSGFESDDRRAVLSIYAPRE
jgi:hypothetical protein